MALYSLLKITVLCALLYEAAAAGTPACSGTRTEADPSSSPDGVYSQTNVEVPNIPQVQVKHIDVIFNQPQPFAGLQTYTLDLDACVVMGDMCMKIPDASAPFTDGRFIDTGSNQGSMFIPRSSEPMNPINELLKIQWCPDQNYFLVKFAGQLLEPLRHQPTVFSTVAPHPDASTPGKFTCIPNPDGICPSNFYPVCGADGVTYGNECEALRACQLDGSTPGTCTCKPNPTPRCTKEYVPVCGKNGVTYGNECLAKAACQVGSTPGKCQPTQCGGTASPVMGSQCGRGGTPCGDGFYCDIDPSDRWAVCCPRFCKPNPGGFCTQEVDEVCGKDGVTYGNACKALLACQLDGSTPGKC